MKTKTKNTRQNSTTTTSNVRHLTEADVVLIDNFLSFLLDEAGVPGEPRKRRTKQTRTRRAVAA